jgi:hypothetical protein
MTFRGRFRSFSLVLTAVFVSLGTLFVASGTAQADDFCPSGNVCFWKQVSFQGEKRVFGAAAEGGWWIIDGTNFRSIKNHYDNRAVWTALFGGPITCTNPGTNRPDPGVFTHFFVGASGSRC